MRKKHSGHALPIIIILVVSLAFGGVFELLCLGGERLSHPRKYQDFVTQYAAEYGVPEAVIYAMLKVESNFDSTKHGEHDKIGLLQLSPALYVRLATEAHDAEMNAAALYDPDTNIRYGVWYLSYLYGKFESWDVAFAAYNAGPGNVLKWLDSSEYSSDGKTLDYIPFKETRNYVEKVNKAIKIYEKLYYSE